MSLTRNALLSRLLPFSEATIDAMPREIAVMHLERAIHTERLRALGSKRYSRNLSGYSDARLASLEVALEREQRAAREVA
jgi:hypothetical protein